MRRANASFVWALVFDAGLNFLVALERRLYVDDLNHYSV
jgi:hypothetical protein